MVRQPHFASGYQAAALLIFALGMAAVGFFMVLPFLAAILWALVLAILFAPIYSRLKTKWEKKPLLKDGRAETLASLTATVVALVMICLPLVLLGAALYIQWRGVAVGSQQSMSVPSVLHDTDRSLQPFYDAIHVPDFKIAKAYEENKEDIVQALQEPAKQIARKAGMTVFTLVVALLTMFFMLRDGHRLRDPAVELLPLPREKSLALFDRIRDTVRAVFVGTVLVALIQGALIGVAYAIAGVPGALILAVFSALACVIPLLGAPVVYVPVGLYLLIQGNVTGALIVLLTGFLLVSQIDNVLKPFFIGSRANLHPMGIFFSILGGVILLGPVGVVAGPMILTILLATQEFIRETKSTAAEPEPLAT